MESDLDITGAVAAKLLLSSDTTDADVFIARRVFDPAGKEVVFVGSNDPRTPVGLGWLRASQRKCDPVESKPYRPWHTHDEVRPLKPGVPMELDVEIWPTSIVVSVGYRIGFTVRGKDYEYDGPGVTLSNMKNVMRGCGPFVHDDPADRPAAIFGGKVTLHANEKRQPYLLLPLIP